MSIPCVRCGRACALTKPEAMLNTLVCAECGEIADVRAFLEVEQQWRSAERARADAARLRFESRALRLQREETERLAKLAERSAPAPSAQSQMPDHIRDALQRARNRTPSKP